VIREVPPGKKGGTDRVHKVSGKRLNVDVGKTGVKTSDQSWKPDHESPSLTAFFALTRRAPKGVDGEREAMESGASGRGSNTRHAGGSTNRAVNPGWREVADPER